MSHPIPDAWFHRVKSATRDLVKLCGGVERAGEIALMSKSEVSRWQASGPEVIIPITAALALEAECGVPCVTAAMAGLGGRRLTEADEAPGGDASAIMSRHAELMRAVGEMMTVYAAAAADGKFSPAEAEQMDRAASSVSRSLDAWRADVAAAKGPRLVAGG
jgi:hypothetical protein